MLPTFPNTRFIKLAATINGNGDSVDADAPPANTSECLASKRCSATTKIRSLAIPVCLTTPSKVTEDVSRRILAMTSSLSPDPLPRSTKSFRTAKASRISDPGLAISQVSAFAPVKDNLGSTCTTRHGFFLRLASAQPRAYSHGDIQVSKKSVPKLRITSAFSRS